MQDSNNKDGKQPSNVTAVLIVVAVAMSALALLTAMGRLAFASDVAAPETLPIGHVVDQARMGQIARITVPTQGNEITIEYMDGSLAKSIKEQGSLLDYLHRAGVPSKNIPTVEVQQPSQPGFGGILGSLFPIMLFGALMVGLFYLFSRRRPMGGAGDQTTQATQFARSRVKVIATDRPNTTFEDVAGADEAKEELTEIVDFLKHPEKYMALGARIPKGLLMVGPPGTGKTLLARAVAGEAGVPFLSISGSEFVEMFVGVGAARVRDLFDQARKNAPCIVFVDEIDAVGRQRGAGLGGGNDEREQTLNQILVEMDGFDARTNIIVVAATNRPDVLDPALLRPGRFDRHILLDRPDSRGRLAILKVHARGKPIDPNVDLEALGKMTPGFSGADLENLLNEAALLAARRNSKSISHQDLQESVDRVVAGPRRKSRIITTREKAITAYHEAGHALVAHVLPHVDPVQKITIVSRGMTGGYTRVVPTEDRHLFSRSEFKETMCWALGGHAAEQIIFGEMTTGASNDIERATQIARRMVTEYGMSDKLGPVAFGRKDDAIFLGRDIGEQRNYSNEIAYAIDLEVKGLMEEANKTAREILQSQRDILVTLAEALIEQETLEGEDLTTLLNGGTVPKREPESGEDDGSTASSAEDEPEPAHNTGDDQEQRPQSSGSGPVAEAAAVLLSPEEQGAANNATAPRR